MSLKGQKTTSDYIEWNALQNLILRLEKDKNYKFAVLIAVGAFTGLRIGDIRQLKWSDFVDSEYLSLTERKTKKHRRIKINANMQEIVMRNREHLDKGSDWIFVNRDGTKPISTQYINREIKKIVAKYRVVRDPGSIKSHSLRKSFGRRVFETNDNSEKSLILLNEIFNHSSIKTTKIYIGIRDQEIADVYEGL